MSLNDLDPEVQKHINEMMSRSNKTGVQPFITTNGGIFEMGEVFEAETVKGNKNYVIFFFVKAGWVYYFHGDKAKKVREEQFQKLIDYGDLVYVPREKRDPEKLSLSVLGLNAMVNGLSFNDYLKVAFGYGDGSQASQFVKD